LKKYIVGFCGSRKTGKKEESLKPIGVSGYFMELLARFELATSSLPSTSGAVWASNRHPKTSILLERQRFL